MTNEPYSLYDEYIPSLDIHTVAVIDWLIMEGGDLVVETIVEENPFSVFLNGFDIYIGPPTCEDEVSVHLDERYFSPNHVVEIASLVEMGSPLPIELLRKIVSPIQQRISSANSGHSITIEVTEMDNDRCIWVVRRFTPQDIEGSQFDAIMREHLALTQEVNELL
jgi:hypothetical protein